MADKKKPCSCGCLASKKADAKKTKKAKKSEKSE